jgi:DNA-binding Lrp family transcriptional regulator
VRPEAEQLSGDAALDAQRRNPRLPYTTARSSELYHRRAGFSANGMGVWKVPEAEILETGKRMAAFRGVSHCYQRPTYADWPYSVFTMAHGRSKEECDAILDSISASTGITERATLYSSTEFKKVRMLYFTDAFRRWEEERA